MFREWTEVVESAETEGETDFKLSRISIRAEFNDSTNLKKQNDNLHALFGGAARLRVIYIML